MTHIPTDLLLYELPHYPSNAARAEHFESRASALRFARHIATLYAGEFVAELFPAKAGAAAFDPRAGCPYEVRRIRPRRELPIHTRHTLQKEHEHERHPQHDYHPGKLHQARL